MKRLAMSVAFLLCLASPVLAAELVGNGSFEQPVVGSCTFNSGTWCYEPSATVPSWTVEWITGGAGNLEFQTQGTLGLTPPDANQYSELGTHGRTDSRVRIYQDLDTCPDTDYTITYYWRSRTSSDRLNVKWGSTLLDSSVTNTTTWTFRSFTRPATSITTRLEFAEGKTSGNLTLGSFVDAVSVEGCKLLPVLIDIKPGSDPNSINCSSKGVIPVAILGSATLDVSVIDPLSVNLNGAGVKLVGKKEMTLCHQEDVNNDGFTDLVCQIVTVDFIIESGDTTATLTATTFDKTQGFIGTDSINIVQDGNCIQ